MHALRHRWRAVAESLQRRAGVGAVVHHARPAEAEHTRVVHGRGRVRVGRQHDPATEILEVATTVDDRARVLAEQRIVGCVEALVVEAPVHILVDHACVREAVRSGRRPPREVDRLEPLGLEAHIGARALRSHEVVDALRVGAEQHLGHAAIQRLPHGEVAVVVAERVGHHSVLAAVPVARVHGVRLAERREIGTGHIAHGVAAHALEHGHAHRQQHGEQRKDDEHFGDGESARGSPPRWRDAIALHRVPPFDPRSSRSRPRMPPVVSRWKPPPRPSMRSPPLPRRQPSLP